MKMNTNRKELTLDEMEQVNGGVLPILLGLGTIALGGGMIALFSVTCTNALIRQERNQPLSASTESQFGAS